MILGIETSTPRASLAVRDPESGEIVATREFSSDRAHNAVIFSPLAEIMEQYRDRLRQVVVGLGPGTYGGIRVGIAVADGLSVGLGLPTAGVSSLEAWEVPEESHVILGDARRGSFFVAEIVGRRPVGDPRLIPTEKMNVELEPFRERGVPLYSSDPRVVEMVEGTLLAFPSAARLLDHAPDAGERSEPLQPHYLRAPYITTPKDGLSPRVSPKRLSDGKESG